jgi:hypothetical protein
MPPRYAYWTILIDGQATAFRARDREDLEPTLRQLSRTSRNVVMKWFARGRLWNSPEAARESTSAPVGPDRRGTGRRPGGAHREPRRGSGRNRRGKA